MDVVLEVFDTFLFDWLYAAVLPSTAHYDYLKGNPNATLAEIRQELPYSTFHYTPATNYISFEPSQWAYKSQWNRDNAFRQGLSLFLITW